jgi:type I restriction enzyme, S subunit
MPRAKTWPSVKVDDIKAPGASAIAIGPFGSRMKSDTYTPAGVPVVRGNNISDTTELKGDFVFISPEFAEELSNCKLVPGDLFFPHRGNIGDVGIITGKRGDRFIMSTSLMKLTPDRSKIDPYFLFYFFRSPAGRHELLKNASQVGTPGIATPLASLRSLDVPLPPLHEQKAIAELLRVLDDKIDLNRQMNATLETMARALFQAWFVDFEPVRAKVGGAQSFPGMPQTVFDTLPARLVDSETGAIPDGWRIGPILDHAELISGGTPDTANPSYWGGEIPWASAKDVSQCGQSFLIETERFITPTGLVNSSTKVIPAWSTVIVARGATTGRMAMFGGDIVMNQTCYALRSRIGADASLYCQLRQCVEQLVHAAHGSVFDTITTRTFQTSAVVLPPTDLLLQLEQQIRPLFQGILLQIRESSTLRAIRDALLPKLLSGEVRVRP